MKNFKTLFKVWTSTTTTAAATSFSFSSSLCFSFNQLSMASVPLSSLCFSQTPKSLCFSFVASDNLRFSSTSSSSSLRFLTPKKNRTRIRVSVCRAASPSLVFRNLDADDFRHPLDKQVWVLLTDWLTDFNFVIDFCLFL